MAHLCFVFHVLNCFLHLVHLDRPAQQLWIFMEEVLGGRAKRGDLKLNIGSEDCYRVQAE